jgi:hypothetical protein
MQSAEIHEQARTEAIFNKGGDVEALEVLDFRSQVFRMLSYQLKLLYIKLFGDASPL